MFYDVQITTIYIIATRKKYNLCYLFTNKINISKVENISNN